MHPTEESSSTVCFPRRNQVLRCASHRRIKCTKFLKKLWGVHPTVESSSAVCIWPQCQATWCASHPRVKLRGVHHTVELNYTLRSQNRKFHWSLGALKGTIRRNPFMGEHIFHERRDLKKNTLPLSHKSHALLSFDKEHRRAMEDLRKI